MPHLWFDDGGPLLGDARCLDERVLLPRACHELEPNGQAVFGIAGGHTYRRNSAEIGQKRKAHHLEGAAKVALAVWQATCLNGGCQQPTGGCCQQIDAPEDVLEVLCALVPRLAGVGDVTLVEGARNRQ